MPNSINIEIEKDNEMGIWKNWLDKKLQENSMNIAPIAQEINRFLNDRSVMASVGQQPNIITVSKHWRPMREGEPEQIDSINIEVYQDDNGSEIYSSNELKTKYGSTQFYDV